MRPRRLLGALVFVAGCASSPEPVDAPPAPAPRVAPPAPVQPPPPPPPPPPAMQATELSEQAWLKQMREKLAPRLKVDGDELRFSPGRQLVTFVRVPAPPRRPLRRPLPRRFQIEVADLEGRRRALFRPVVIASSDEPPKDLRFLGEERVVYEVVLPPPAPRPPGGRRAPKKATVPAPPPRFLPPERRLFVIHALARPSRPIRCDGVRFSLTEEKDRLAYITGRPDAAFVAVDGVQVYPRRGHTILPSNVAWSKDGQSLAFLEARTGQPARLVLLAAYDNPTGDTLWDLPPTLPLAGMRVFWSGADRLVVGKSLLHPAFATSFEKSGGGS